MRIGVRGYQSITSGVVDIQPGEIVLLRGSNNTGKSAFIRAIASFITNYSTSDDYINVDIGSAKVIVKDDKVYEWRRLKNTASYFVDGVEEKKLNRASIAEVMPEAGFLYLKTDTDKFLPQIASEGSIWFPYNQNPSAAFRLFSKFMAPPKLSVLISDLKSTIKEEKQELERVRGQVDVYETESSRLEEELENLPSVEDIDALLVRVGKWIVAKQKYEGLGIRLQSAKKTLEKTQGVLLKFEGKKEEFDSLEKRIDKVKEGRQKLASMKVLVERLKVVEDSLLRSAKRREELQSFIDVQKPRVEKIQKARELIVKVNRVVKVYNSSIVRLDECERNYKELKDKMAEFKSCPLCEREF